jgi:hypothetical protein
MCNFSGGAALEPHHPRWYTPSTKSAPSPRREHKLLLFVTGVVFVKGVLALRRSLCRSHAIVRHLSARQDEVHEGSLGDAQRQSGSSVVRRSSGLWKAQQPPTAFRGVDLPGKALT